MFKTIVKVAILFREAVAVEVRVHKDGGGELFHGAQDIGTGIRTALAVIGGGG